MNNHEENEFVRLARQLRVIQPSPAKVQQVIDRVHQALDKAQYVKKQEPDKMEIDKQENDEIVRNLESLSRITPSSERIQQAIARAKNSLDRYPSSSSRIKYFRRVLAVGLVAAAIFVTFVLLNYFILGNEVHAGISFASVIEAQKTYNKWYRVDVEEYDDLKALSLHDPYDTYYYLANPNFENGVSVYKTDEGFWAYWLEKPQSTIYFYNKKAKILTISSGIELNGRVIDFQTLPLQSDLISILGELEANSVLNASQWDSVPDGSYERFDIPETCFVDKKIRENIGSVTLWVDPVTKLIQKWQSRCNTNKSYIFRFNYDILPIRSVYDLGVSTIAKVIDNRPTLEVQKLLVRLELHRGINEQFGEYVAVLTNSRVGEGTTLQKGDLLVYSHWNQGWVYAEYSANEISGLTGWPSPEAGEVLKRTQAVPSNHIYVDQNSVGWEGWYQADQKSYRLSKVESDRRDLFLAGFSLSGFLWPGPSTIYSDEFDFRVRNVKIITDDAHPGLTGLVVDQWGFGPQKDQNRVVRTYWLDPERDDLPAEREYRSYSPDGPMVLETKTKFLNYNQLSTGQWYPVSWRSVTSRYENGQIIENYENGSHLTITSNLELDENWYKELAGRLNLPKE